MLFHSEVIFWTQTDIQSRPIAAPAPLKCSVTKRSNAQESPESFPPEICFKSERTSVQLCLRSLQLLKLLGAFLPF